MKTKQSIFKQNKRQYVVNFYGGPGTGKSTVAAALFAKLKEIGLCAELVCEYAKDLTWQKSLHVLNNQIKIFGEQQHRLWRVRDQTDIVVTDSPLLLSTIYNKGRSPALDVLVHEEYRKYINIDIFLRRTKKYECRGRSQTLDEAKALDELVLSKLDQHSEGYYIVDGRLSSIPEILTIIKSVMKKYK